jgi:hypothetical protein
MMCERSLLSVSVTGYVLLPYCLFYFCICIENNIYGDTDALSHRQVAPALTRD